jgi:hypothetical protein
MEVLATSAAYRDEMRDLRENTALARALLDELDRATHAGRGNDARSIAPQLADELTRLAARIVSG